MARTEEEIVQIVGEHSRSLSEAAILREEDIDSLIGADVEDCLILILVEGETDIQFIECVLSESPGKILCKDGKQYPGYSSGKNSLYDLLDATSGKDWCKRVIAIRDRDYSDPDAYPDRMFAYDHCCLEMMLLSHPEVQKRVRANYTIIEERPYIPLCLMRLIAPFSLLRKKNELQGLEIDFGNSGVLLGCGKNRLPDMEILFRKHQLEDQYDLFQTDANHLSDEELWEITNGHDICSLLGKSVRLGKGALGADGLFRFLLSVYRLSDFASTNLYSDLEQYQRIENLTFLPS